jgi:hypothetical protein
MNYRKVATDLYNAGLSVMPIGEKKQPIGKWTVNQNGPVLPDNRFDDCLGIGVCCGTPLNIQCVDIDCKYDLTGVLFEEYKTEINSMMPGLLKKMTVQKTQNGGYHFIFRCEEIAGNQKIANREATKEEQEIKKEKTKTLIETREKGGYIMIAPSPGYEFIYGDITNLCEITPEERNVLLTSARLFNTFYQKHSDYSMKKAVDDVSPFEDYNDRGDLVDFLKGMGWTETGTNKGNIMLLRPGGDKLWSAGFHPEMRLFKCFSQSTEFDVTKAYNPSTVLSMLKFNNDFKETAKWLYDNGYGKKSQLQKTEKKEAPKAIPVEDIEKILMGSAIDLTKPIEKPPTILSVREKNGTSLVYKRLFTLGNFSCLTGKAKTKKTFLLTLFTSAILKEKDYSSKLFSEVPENKKTVLYFDTEQGMYDSYICMKRVQTLSGLNNTFRAFNIRQYDPKQRCEIIEYALKLWAGESCLCVIDGIADLAVGINDEEDATRVTTLLLRWTKEYNIHIATVIHQNKNDGFATGHLGSSIMKKAEIIISVSKSTNDARISDVKNEMGRGVDFEPFSIFINDDGIPEIIDYAEPARKSKKEDNQYRELVDSGLKQNDDFDKVFDGKVKVMEGDPF